MDGVDRLHDQPGPPACRRSPRKGAATGDELEDPACTAADQALGRSRGGLTIKIHLACEGRGLPLTVVVTPGNVNDSTVFATVLDAPRVPRTGAGRPRRRLRFAEQHGFTEVERYLLRDDDTVPWIDLRLT